MDKFSLPPNFLDTFDYVLTDCDGVLWRGDDVIPGSAEALNFLREKRKTIVFVTNNSSKTRSEYFDKCEELGIISNTEEMYPTSYCVAKYLKSQNFTKKVYVLGCHGIVKELDSVGIECLPIGSDPVPEEGYSAAATKLHLDPQVGAVVIGFDPFLSYMKLLKATSYIKNQGCQFIASNADYVYPSDRLDLTYPGTGTLVKAVEMAVGHPPVILGKPNKFIYDCIQSDHPDMRPERCVFFGDWVKSDILLANTVGIPSILVLSGITTFTDIEYHQEHNNSQYVPTYILPCLGELLKLFKNS